MPTILPELSQRLRDTLVRCSALESDRAMRAIFVDVRLAPWRDHVPENAPNRAARVALLVAALADQTSAHGDNALVLLLDVLAESLSPDNALHNELLALARTLESFPATDVATFAETVPTYASRYTTMTGGQVGVIGDNAHVEGGIHFDQRGQQVHQQINAVNYYAAPASPTASGNGRRDFYQHISLPPHHIPRTEALAGIRAALLENPGSVALTSAVQMNALHGMGIGKTVLAVRCARMLKCKPPSPTASCGQRWERRRT